MNNAILDLYCVKYSVPSCYVVMCHSRCSLTLLHKCMQVFLKHEHDLTTAHTTIKLQDYLGCSLI